ncbi:MAG: hypothetical protein ACP5N2_03790 [Candidatus Nanoarchaeia archaeon]
MKKVTFTKKYFKQTICDDPKNKVRVVINENPSMDVENEDYSLRIETMHQNPEPVHRNYAIEHHRHQEKHQYPHIQFKFHTEGIGSFWLRLDFDSSEEYEQAILGFIYKMKNILQDLEQYREGITEEMLILDLVNKLEKEGDFLTQKMFESIQKYQIEFQTPSAEKDKLPKIASNLLLVEFLGDKNIKRIQEIYAEKTQKKK